LGSWWYSHTRCGARTVLLRWTQLHSGLWSHRQNTPCLWETMLITITQSLPYEWLTLWCTFMLYNYVVNWKHRQYDFLAPHSSNKHCQTIWHWQVRASSNNSNKLTNEMQQPWLISNLMHKILIYLHIIHLLKSSTCFEHYSAHLQEVYVVIVYNRCTGQSPADSDDTRGCIYSYDVDLLKMSRVMLDTCRGF
jgi:hypothetical protein